MRVLLQGEIQEALASYEAQAREAEEKRKTDGFPKNTGELQGLNLTGLPMARNAPTGRSGI